MAALHAVPARGGDSLLGPGLVRGLLVLSSPLLPAPPPSSTGSRPAPSSSMGFGFPPKPGSSCSMGLRPSPPSPRSVPGHFGARIHALSVGLRGTLLGSGSFLACTVLMLMT